MAAMHLVCDKFLRLRNKLRRSLRKKTVFNPKNKVSDSQASFYTDSLLKIKKNQELNNFRRNFDYREILEHVNYSTGKKYIERIQILGFDLKELIALGIENDQIGNPRTYKYGKLAQVSPTTLRYLSVACEIQTRFGNLDGMKVVEIGAGYGGQMAVLSRMFKLSSYDIYDLPDAQALISKYTDAINVPLKPTMLDINSIEEKNADLLISNYAYSELPSHVQSEYLSKVLSNCNRGFMIMNSGLTNLTGRTEGKLLIDEIQKKLPKSVIEKEIPLTSEDNYLLTWK